MNIGLLLARLGNLLPLTPGSCAQLGHVLSPSAPDVEGSSSGEFAREQGGPRLSSSSSCGASVFVLLDLQYGLVRETAACRCKDSQQNPQYTNRRSTQAGTLPSAGAKQREPYHSQPPIVSQDPIDQHG